MFRPCRCNILGACILPACTPPGNLVSHALRFTTRLLHTRGTNSNYARMGGIKDREAKKKANNVYRYGLGKVDEVICTVTGCMKPVPLHSSDCGNAMAKPETATYITHLLSVSLVTLVRELKYASMRL